MDNAYLLLTNKFVNKPDLFTVKFGTWLSTKVSLKIGEFIKANNYDTKYRYNFFIIVHDEKQMMLHAIKEDILLINLNEIVNIDE